MDGTFAAIAIGVCGFALLVGWMRGAYVAVLSDAEQEDEDMRDRKSKSGKTSKSTKKGK